MNLRPKIAGAALIAMVIIIASGALFMALRFAQSEAQRDILVWQRQMAVVVNSREVAVEEWLTDQKKIIARLANNPSLRIYLGNIAAVTETLAAANPSQEYLAQAAYLENQMKAAAVQNGYAPQINRDFAVNANLSTPPLSGLALTNAKGQIIVSTPNMPSVLRSVADALAQKAKGVTSFGPYISENGSAVIAFISTVYGVQDDNDAAPLGFAVGIKEMPEDFYQKLKQPGEMSVTAQNYLVRRADKSIEYLSPLRLRNGDLQQPLQMTLDAQNPSLAAVFAVENSSESAGGYAQRANFEGESVLVTGRKIQNTDWVLVRTIDSKEVMGAIVSRKRTIIGMAGLIILAVSISLLLIWRHGVSIRVARAAERQKQLSDKYEKLSHFMRIVTDSQPTVITAVDGGGHYTFANRQAVLDAGLSHDEMIGRKTSSTTGSLKSDHLEHHYQQVLEQAEPLSIVEKFSDEGITIKSEYIPLSVGQEQGVLMVVEDISELVKERELKETALKNLVNTLTMVIDSRDPYSARHSERVALVSRAIAIEMNADKITCETANIAGALMNLGKILVPREILTRPKGLSEGELSTIRSSIMKSADMLETVEFDGPVVKTLRQVGAHWDGSGMPEGLAGEDILLAARIVAVANAFVGMSSARAHRAGMNMVEAATLLLNDTYRIYDRKPVTALMNYLENKGGLEEWEDFGISLTSAEGEQP